MPITIEPPECDWRVWTKASVRPRLWFCMACHARGKGETPPECKCKTVTVG